MCFPFASSQSITRNIVRAFFIFFGHILEILCVCLLHLWLHSRDTASVLSSFVDSLCVCP